MARHRQCSVPVPWIKRASLHSAQCVAGTEQSTWTLAPTRFRSERSHTPETTTDPIVLRISHRALLLFTEGEKKNREECRTPLPNFDLENLIPLNATRWPHVDYLAVPENKKLSIALSTNNRKKVHNKKYRKQLLSLVKLLWRKRHKNVIRNSVDQTSKCDGKSPVKCY